MAISPKIIQYLEEKKYKYVLVDHKIAYTAWDKAQTEKADPRAVAKALVMKADGKPVLAVLSGNKNLDKAKLLKVINTARKKAKEKPAKKIEFAKEAWMKKNILGSVGATPPFSGILGFPVFADKTLLKNKKIYLGSGVYTQSFLVSVSQYKKTEKPAEGNFSQKK